MINIRFSPIASTALEPLKSLSVKGYAITLNGEVFDFTELQPGYQLEQVDIESDWFVDRAVMSLDGVLSVAILMPYDEATATDAIRFPEPVTVTAAGPVDIPTNHPAQPPVTPTVEDDHGLLAEQENLH
ncbi:hypothetical protein [Pseudomonas piscis]|uniref:hypothetical protein n=1 Tax=Pseudomonas piscis TaxID=2614538 RepID=UPI0003B66B59|nr:hypothetical protein [Pseudomonas piscis]ERO61169.1 hypothetical protein P308_10585 [Pseudomonas piscis]ERO65318.1 hypothetical protein P308_19855 [Pseudomonas piscis]